MRKILPIALVICILASCAKPGASTNGGTWTFHSNTYKATQAYYVLGSLTAYTGTNVPTGSLALWFKAGNTGADTFATTWPPKPGTYILTNSYPPPVGYAFIQLTDSSLFNSYTITGSTTPSITVTTVHDTLVSVNIPPVMVINTNGTPPFYPQIIGKPTGTDSSLVSGTVIQTQ
jgi:hypothetical protein